MALPIFLLIFWLIKRKAKVSNLKEFLKKRAPAGIVGGIWAMIPDMDYFLEEPMFQNAPWNEVFFLHSSFDKVANETDLFFAAEIFLIFVAVNLFAIAATVESFKRLGEALFGKDEEEEEEEGEEKEGVKAEVEGIKEKRLAREEEEKGKKEGQKEEAGEKGGEEKAEVDMSKTEVEK